jgi:hypothetical protein
MGVYVDKAENPYGRMTMCHMVADTTKELYDMASAIGIPLKWVQKRDTPDEHFDICKAKRALAIEEGAKEITPRELVRIIRSKRAASHRN